MATLDKVSLDISVVLGTTDMPIHQVLRLGRGGGRRIDDHGELLGGLDFAILIVGCESR